MFSFCLSLPECEFTSGWCDQLVCVRACFPNVALKKCRAKEFGTAAACESGGKDQAKKENELMNLE